MARARAETRRIMPMERTQYRRIASAPRFAAAMDARGAFVEKYSYFIIRAFRCRRHRCPHTRDFPVADDLDRLFRLYHRELRQLAYRRLGDPETAADLAQDAFVRYAGLIRKHPRQAIANPQYFLWRILRNLIIDLRRGQARRGEQTSLDEAESELHDQRPGPERLLELRQQLQLLHRAFEELPPACRDALLLNRVEGLSHAAIAERLGVSPSMVCKYIMRALRHCIRRLGLADGAN